MHVTKTPTVVKEAFYISYMGGEVNRTLEHFILHVTIVYEAWKSLRNRYYSPYFSVFQSSGSGKSKLFNSLVNSYWVCYISLATDKAYPQTPILKQSLISTSTKLLDLSYYFSYFCAIMQSWNQARERDPKGHYVWSEKWFNDERVINEADIKQHKDRADAFSTEVDFEKYARKLFNDTIDETQFPLLIIFDEARAMNETGDFEVVRRALRCFTKGVVAIFADTMSSLCNFAPSSEADPSFRPRMHMDLFPPFYQLRTFDLFARQKRYLGCKLWEYGRVIWAAFKLCNISDKELINFAQSKLLGGYEELDVTTITTEIAMAIFSSFACIEITPSSSLSKRVVAGNMAICLHVSQDRSSIMVQYPSDPVLSEAAVKLLQDEFDHRKRMQMLKELAHSLVNCLVERGKRGELIASLTIGLAMQKCQKSTFPKRDPFRYSRAISLKAFLDVFIGIDSDVIFKLLYVKFSHSKKITKGKDKLSRKLLNFGWDRCCYFLCEENQEAIDIVIPTSYDAYNYKVRTILYFSGNLHLLKCFFHLERSSFDHPN